MSNPSSVKDDDDDDREREGERERIWILTSHSHTSGWRQRERQRRERQRQKDRERVPFCWILSDTLFALLTPQDEDRQTERDRDGRDRKTERGFLVAGCSVTFFLLYFSEQATPPTPTHTHARTHTHPIPHPSLLCSLSVSLLFHCGLSVCLSLTLSHPILSSLLLCVVTITE